MWILTRSDTNQAGQPLKVARGLKFCIKEVEVLYYPSSENKDADQLRGYREADLRPCFRMCKTLFSHEMLNGNVNSTEDRISRDRATILSIHVFLVY